METGERLGFVLLLCLIFSILSPENGIAVTAKKTIIDHEYGYRVITSEVEETPIGASSIKGDDDRVNLLWQGGDDAAITGEIGVSTVTGNSFVGWDLNDNRCSLYHDSFHAEWENEFGNDYDFCIDMLEDGSFMVAGVDHIARGFLPTSSTPVWEQIFTGIIGGLVLSPDGTRAYVGEYRSPGTTYIYCYQVRPVPSSQPIWETSFDEGPNGLVLSGDGNFLVLSQYSNLRVMDAADGSVIFDAPNQNQNLPAISYDGSILVNGNYSGYAYVYTYDQGMETYRELWNFHVYGGGQYIPWVTGMAVSGDGSTIAIGSAIFYSDGRDGMVYLFNSYSSNPIWSFENMGDKVSCLDMSYDGSVIAVGGWGPMDNSIADFFLFRRNSNVPVFSINSPGSIKHLDISADGALCTVGGKAVHASTMGHGGTLYSVDCDLGGGFVSGAVDLQGYTDNSGALVRIQEISGYFDITETDGSYCVNNVPAGTYTVEASKVGFQAGIADHETVVDACTTFVDFVLQSTGDPPENLDATQGVGTTVMLSWGPPQTRDPIGYNIYRKDNSTGPYQDPLASVPASQLTYEDSQALPFVTYYYVATSLYAGDLEGPYSNEAIGWISTDFIVDEIGVYHGETPVIDGMISEGEWDDAFMVDVSDFMGQYDNMPDPIGSVICYFKTNDNETELYIACVDSNDTVLEDHDEVALYIDDNNDDAFPPTGDDSEGNYWAVHYASGDLIKYRPLHSSGGPGVVIDLVNPEIAVSAASGFVVYEFIIPIGIEDWEIAITPNTQDECGLFAFVLDDPDEFDGWWPYDVTEVFEPLYYGTLIFGATGEPPAAPEHVAITRSGDDVILTWDAVQGATDYRIYVSNVPFTGFSELSTTGGATTYTHIGAGTANESFYRVTALNNR